MMLEHLEIGRNVLLHESAVLAESSSRLDQAFCEAVDLLLNLEKGCRVVVCGVGKSGHVGRKISATLASLGVPGFFMHATEGGHGDLGMLCEGDIMLAISQSGESDELISILPNVKALGVSILAITGDSDSSLAKQAKIVISSKVDRECCPLGLAPMASTTLTLGLGDALAAAVASAGDFTATGFAHFHPFGSLGRNLTLTVRDVMLAGDSIPKTDDSSSIIDAVSEMTRVGLGLVCITDQARLRAVFTDGDLRRTVQLGHLMSDRLTDIQLSTDFHCFKEGQLASECLSVMASLSINSGPVVNASGELVGVINMRMLLQAGISDNFMSDDSNDVR